ncbi:MAG: hypothetical protein LLF99_19050 [Desulfobacteraceae bacterium]|nr:hypothetical protein [Desulfobacteraceae bacterium]
MTKRRRACCFAGFFSLMLGICFAVGAGRTPEVLGAAGGTWCPVVVEELTGRDASFPGIAELFSGSENAKAGTFQKFDAQGSLVGTYVNELDRAGRLAQRISLDGSGRVLGYTQYDYTATGELSHVFRYGTNGGQVSSLTGYSLFEYGKAGECSSILRFDSTEAPCGRTTVEHEGGTVLAHVFAGDGSLSGTCTFHTDAQGRCTRIDYPEGVATAVAYSVFERNDDGTAGKVLDFGRGGKLISYTFYEYDALGSVVKASVYDSRSVLAGYWTVEYSEETAGVKGPALESNTAAGAANSVKSIAASGAEAPLPVVSFAGPKKDASEKGATSPGTITVRRTGSLAGALTVKYSVGGTATSGSDFETLSGVVEIPDTKATVSFTVNPIQDSDYEGIETVVVTLEPDSAYTIGSPSSQTIKIGDDDKPTVSIEAEVDDTDEGKPAEPGVFVIKRTGNTSSPLAVKYVISGEAKNGTDYITLPGSVNIPKGSSSATLNVVPKGDDIYEGDERVIITLLASRNYNLGDPLIATVTIEEDETPPPEVSVVASVEEIVEGSSTPVVFTFTSAVAPTSDFKVKYIVSGTAKRGANYTPLPGTVTIPAGETAATVSFSAKENSTYEGAREVTVSIPDTPTQSKGDPDSATVTILENDKPVISIRATDAKASENKLNPGKFTVSRSTGKFEDLVVTLTVAGTAVPGVDYEVLPATVTIPKGKLSVDIPVVPKMDGQYFEGGKTVVATIADDPKYTVSSKQASATVTISDSAFAGGTFVGEGEGEGGGEDIEFELGITATSTGFTGLAVLATGNPEMDGMAKFTGKIDREGNVSASFNVGKTKIQVTGKVYQVKDEDGDGDEDDDDWDTYMEGTWTDSTGTYSGKWHVEEADDEGVGPKYGKWRSDKSIGGAKTSGFLGIIVDDDFTGMIEVSVPGYGVLGVKFEGTWSADAKQITIKSDECEVGDLKIQYSGQGTIDSDYGASGTFEVVADQVYTISWSVDPM